MKSQGLRGFYSVRELATIVRILVSATALMGAISIGFLVMLKSGIRGEGNGFLQHPISAQLTYQESGSVASVYAISGSMVTQGQLLVTLSSPELSDNLSVKYNERLIARHELELLDREIEREQAGRLGATGSTSNSLYSGSNSPARIESLVPRSELEQELYVAQLNDIDSQITILTNHTVVESERRAVERYIDRIKRSEIEIYLARKAIANLQHIAPTDGEVIFSNIPASGGGVMKNGEYGVIVDASQYVAELEFPESKGVYLEVNDTLNIEIAALPKYGFGAGTAIVTAIKPTAPLGKIAVDVRITLSERISREMLRPGMRIRARFSKKILARTASGT